MSIFTSAYQVRQYVNFNGDIGTDELRPFFTPAERFLAKYVGTALLDSLSSINLATEDPESNTMKLFDRVGLPLASLILLGYIGVNNVSIGKIGIMRSKTADSADAFEWQLDRLERTLTTNAFNGIEALLEFLAGNIDTYEVYKNSPQYQREKSKLIPSATLFSEYYQINSSRLVYSTLSASMRTAEMQIRKLLGERLTPLLGPTLNDDQQLQLDAARRALAYLTIARALRERLVTITDQGVQVLGISQVGTINYRNAPSDKQLERSILYFDEQAASFLGDLASLLSEPAPTPTDSSSGSQVINKAIVSF